MSTSEPSTPIYLSKRFYFGLLMGAFIGFGTMAVTYYLETDTICKSVPEDKFVRRIGTDLARTDEETAALEKLCTDFKTKYGIDSAGISYPNFKDGGVIPPCELKLIMASLKPDIDTVFYKFGLDDKGRIVLLLKGGIVNPFSSGSELGQPLILYNGISDDVFCPTHCGDWLLPDAPTPSPSPTPSSTPSTTEPTSDGG